MNPLMPKSPVPHHKEDTQSVSSRSSERTTPEANPQTQLVLQMLREMQESNDRRHKDLQDKYDDLLNKFNLLEVDLTTLQREHKDVKDDYSTFKRDSNRRINEINELATNALNIGNDAKQKADQAKQDIRQLNQGIGVLSNLLQQQGNSNLQINQTLQTIQTNITNLQTSMNQNNQAILTLQTTTQNTLNSLSELATNFGKHYHSSGTYNSGSDKTQATPIYTSGPVISK